MAANAQLLQRAEARIESDGEFASVLEALLDVPAASAGTYRRAAASAVNELRRRDALRSFQEAALPTSAVRERLGLDTAQAVHRLRSRGRIIGVPIGNRTWFPAWQLSGARLRPDLRDVLDALHRFSSDPIALDRVMRLERDELGGRSIADVLDDPKASPAAWVILRKLGD